MSIGQRISALRKEKSISQGQLARALDVSRQAVSKWENDLSAPDTVKLIQLADLLEVDVEYLATGRKTTVPSPSSDTNIAASPVIVEKIVEVEKPVTVEKIVEVECVVEVEKTIIRRRTKIRYVRNPLEFAAIGLAGLILGIAIGLMI